MAIIEVSGGGDALQQAVASANDGDTIIVEDGVYLPIERTDGIYLTIKAKNKHKASIEITSTSYRPNLCRFTLETTPNDAILYNQITVEGFVLDGHNIQIFSDTIATASVGGVYIDCIARNIRSYYSVMRGCTLINCLVYDSISTGHCLCWGNHLYNTTFSNCTTQARGWFLYGKAYNSIFHNITGWDKRAQNFASVRGANNFFPEEVPNCTNTILGTDALLDENYHLAKGSPCIGAGNAEYLQSATDLDGKEWKTPPSIGCYEFYGSKKYLPSSLHPLGV